MRCGRYHNDERGFSLVELLVVMVLLGVVGSIAVQAILTTMQRQSETAQRIEALHELEVALQRAGRDLRSANPLLLSETRSATTMIGARIQRGGENLVISYGLEVEDGDQVLVQRVARVDSSFEDRELVTQVSNTKPIFRYLRADKSEIPCTSTIADCARTFMDEATDVEIRLERGVVGQQPVVVTTTINIRNIRYGS